VSRRFSPVDRLNSLRFALRGLGYLLRFEHNSRIHLVATVAAIIAGLAFGLSLDQRRWVLLAAALVWVGEAFNTAFERLGDAVSLEHHPEIGRAKDVAAAAVLISVVAAALIGLSVFVPKIVHWAAQ
jgi:diacylglycerol kinase (ATP)